MRKFYLWLFVGVVMAFATLDAKAVTVSYTVDAGAGFCTDLVQTSGLSTLTTTPIAGVLDLAPASDFDVVSYTLDTTRTSGGDTIAVAHTYTIRFIEGDFNTLGLDPCTGFAGASETLDWTQTVNWTISGIRKNHDDNTIPVVTITPGTQTFSDGKPVTVTFLSIDVPGAPNVEVAPGTFESVGSKTDHASAVPEPGALALLLGMGVTGSLFTIRRRR